MGFSKGGGRKIRLMVQLSELPCHRKVHRMVLKGEKASLMAREQAKRAEADCGGSPSAFVIATSPDALSASAFPSLGTNGIWKAVLDVLSQEVKAFTWQKRQSEREQGKGTIKP